MSKQPVRVLITGAAGQIGYSFIPLVASGEMLGPDQPVILHLLDIPRALEGLKGVVMEIDDCAYPLVHGVVATVDVAEGFKGIDFAILLGGFPRLQGMNRADLLLKNKDIFFGQGEALAKHASPTCKVLVVANPANTNCLIAYKSMLAAGGKIPRENFTAMMRLDLNRAKSQLAQKLATRVTAVKNVAIWGNHSATQYPDVHFGTITPDDTNPAKKARTSANGVGECKTVPIEKALGADAQKWLDDDFVPTVQTRGASVIKQRGKSSAASAANAAKDHMRDWILGTPEGEHVAMAVITDGSAYGVPADLTFSFPVTCKNGEWTIVPGLELTDKCKEHLKTNIDKLTEERTVCGL